MKIHKILKYSLHLILACICFILLIPFSAIQIIIDFLLEDVIDDDDTSLSVLAFNNLMSSV